MKFDKKQGIIYEMADVLPLNLKGGGVRYWSNDLQMVLRTDQNGKVWARFFPAVDVSQDGKEVGFSLVEKKGAPEAMSRSRGMNEARGGHDKGIPLSELDAFFTGLEDVLSLADTPADPNKKAFLQELRLPDPEKAPERYRLYVGEDGKEHLAVLWGFEGPAGGDNVPVAQPAAAGKGHLRPEFREKFRKHIKPNTVDSGPFVRVALWLLVLVLAVVAGCLLWKRGDHDDGGVQPPPIDGVKPVGQYLYVSPRPVVMVGQSVVAWAKAPGTLAFVGFKEKACEVDEQMAFTYDQVGDYTVSWKPQDSSMNVEIAMLQVREAKSPEEPTEPKPITKTEFAVNFMVTPNPVFTGEMVTAVNNTAKPDGVKEWDDVCIQWGETAEKQPFEKAQTMTFDKAGRVAVTLCVKLGNQEKSATLLLVVRDAAALPQGEDGKPVIPAVDPQPQLVLYPLTGKVKVGETVTADECSKGDLSQVASRTLDWGDGKTEPFPQKIIRLTHEYKKVGKYKVTLTLELKDGRKFTAVKSMEVTDANTPGSAASQPEKVSTPTPVGSQPSNDGIISDPGNSQLPTVVLEISPEEVMVGETVTANDKSPQGNPPTEKAEICWGEEPKAYEPFAEPARHVYAKAGKYTVTLRKVMGGKTYEGTATVTVREPQVMLEINPADVLVGETVTANDKSPRSNPPAEKAEICWGEEPKAFDPFAEPATHAYAKAGKYTVTLRKVMSGQPFEGTATVTVRAPSVEDGTVEPRLSVLPGKAAVGEKVTAVDQSVGELSKITMRKINWGDGKVNTLEDGQFSCEHSYDKAGTYTVFLNLTLGERSLEASADIEITAEDEPRDPVVPVAHLRLTPVSAEAGQTVTAVDASELPAGVKPEKRSIRWGQQADWEPFEGHDTHAFNEAGTYQVTLEITVDGKTYADTASLTVEAPVVRGPDAVSLSEVWIRPEETPRLPENQTEEIVRVKVPVKLEWREGVKGARFVELAADGEKPERMEDTVADFVISTNHVYTLTGKVEYEKNGQKVTARVASEFQCTVKVSDDLARMAVVYIERSMKGVDDHIATGSGVIVSNDGYIVTNHHVVQDTENGHETEAVTVSNAFEGWKFEKAQIIAVDAEADLALLKVDKKASHALSLYDKPLKAGDKVRAWGFPGWLMKNDKKPGHEKQYDKPTPSDGTVSSKEDAVNYYHTAIINHGDSGGALVTTSGRLCGLNTASITRKEKDVAPEDMTRIYVSVKSTVILERFKKYFQAAQ